MLVLTRKNQETIRIGDSITVKVLRTKGNVVKLGIEAPAGVRVLRGELMPHPQIEPAPAGAVEKVAGSQGSRGCDWQSAGEWPHEVEGDVEPVPMKSVLHMRAPRGRVATVLPALLGPSAPLRAMLDRRANTPATAT